MARVSQQDRNPYAPPAAPVGDVAVVEARGPRPAHVSWAVRLFWVDLALSVLQAGVEAARDNDALSMFLGDVVSFGF